MTSRVQLFPSLPIDGSAPEEFRELFQETESGYRDWPSFAAQAADLVTLISPIVSLIGWTLRRKKQNGDVQHFVRVLILEEGSIVLDQQVGEDNLDPMREALKEIVAAATGDYEIHLR